MATLNGTQINQTYRGLVKLSDNQLASSNFKELTDGWGNGLGLYVRTDGSLQMNGDLSVTGTIDATGANKISFYFADQASFPSASTYHGAIAHSHADGKMYFAHNGSWVELALASDVVATLVDDVTIEEDATNGLQLKNDGVSHDKLEGRYTDTVELTGTTGTLNLDCSSYASFNLSGNLATCTISFDNMKTGQVVDVLLSGADLSSAVITLEDNFTTSTINRVGSTDLDTASKNIIQAVCVDDNDTAAVIHYSINTYTAI